MEELSDKEAEILKEMEDGIPLTRTPFEDAADSLDLPVDGVLGTLEKLLDEGKIRRFGASLAHRKIGKSANAMIVWNVPEEQVDDVGKEISKFDNVTHCYKRPRKKDWNYNLFSMVHGDSKSECEKIAEVISEKIDLDRYEIIYSTREFKKTGVKLPRNL
ncbi:MAG: DNA-binding transcriptional regulator Lrp family [Candidatus Methanohalarchaeum thermophilum]|uniref:siroheme decarboxylase n=1 Tax=Methanohalarchaeum thermophilum TaxID=1903181 RepID=A0A1Q6DS58_METT1|nr:MAG: DNA-binding transcriptional regulator Lrp family [Candidatus Methanohalarchaeum thermophilum]